MSSLPKKMFVTVTNIFILVPLFRCFLIISPVFIPKKVLKIFLDFFRILGSKMIVIIARGFTEQILGTQIRF